MLSQWKNAWRINSFSCPWGEAYFSAFVSRWLSQHITSSRSRTVRIGGVETRRYCNNHRNVWGRWDVALCSRCWCEIRQGQFHIFTLSTAAGKFYPCCTVWLLLMCQKWIPLGKIQKLSLSFMFGFLTKVCLIKYWFLCALFKTAFEPTNSQEEV